MTTDAYLDAHAALHDLQAERAQHTWRSAVLTQLGAIEGHLRTLADALRPDEEEQDAPSAAPDGPQEPAEPEEAPEDPDGEIGPQGGVQGRIGWLRFAPAYHGRCLVREVEDGWSGYDADEPTWRRERYPAAVFTPIRTLADDEAPVRRDDLAALLAYFPSSRNGLVTPDGLVARLHAALGEEA